MAEVLFTLRLENVKKLLAAAGLLPVRGLALLVRGIQGLLPKFLAKRLNKVAKKLSV